MDLLTLGTKYGATKFVKNKEIADSLKWWCDKILLSLNINNMTHIINELAIKIIDIYHEWQYNKEDKEVP